MPPREITLSEVDAALARALAILAAEGITGRFVVSRLGKVSQASWLGDGSRTNVNRRAHHVAAEALCDAGITATAVPGMGVVVAGISDETRRHGDIATLHNAEPRPELVEECEREAA